MRIADECRLCHQSVVSRVDECSDCFVLAAQGVLIFLTYLMAVGIVFVSVGMVITLINKGGAEHIYALNRTAFRG